MAVYQTYSHSGADYFSDFKEAKKYLDGQSDDFQRISLMKLDEKTGAFDEEEDYVDLHEGETRALRKLTRKELRELPDKLFTYFNENTDGEYTTTAYIDEESLMKNTLNYPDDWGRLFEKIGTLKKTYAFYMMFSFVVQDSLSEDSFKGAMDALYEAEELAQAITEVTVGNPEKRTEIDYVSSQSEETLHKIYKLAKLFVSL